MPELRDFKGVPIKPGDRVIFAHADWGGDTTALHEGVVAYIRRAGGGWDENHVVLYGALLEDGDTSNNSAPDGGMLEDVMVVAQGGIKNR